MRQIHGTGGLHCQSHAPQYLPQVCDPQELVLLGRHMEVGSLLIDKERVRNPDLVDVIGSDNKLGNSVL